MVKCADSEQIAKAREWEMRHNARKFWNARVIIDGNPATSLDAEKKIITLLAAFAASERQAVKEDCAKVADRIRMNGISTPREAAEHIARAIRSME